MAVVTRTAVPLARHLLRVCDLMDRAYAEQLDVVALARSAGVSRAHFNRGFRQAFGETPHQYLLTRRLERAKALLRESDLTVTEVCFAVGCGSLGSFSTQFRRRVGDSPTGYRGQAAQDAALAAALARVPSCFVRMWIPPRGSVRG
jgi:transcriptional regulator GlxA family with amidase domain